MRARIDPAELRRLARFATVGISNTVVTLVAFTILSRAGLPDVAASALAFALGAVNGYQLNRRWTFGAPGGDRAVVARYALVALAGVGASAGGIALAAHAGLAHLPAEATILPVVTVLTYLLSRHVVFGAPAGAH